MAKSSIKSTGDDETALKLATGSLTHGLKQLDEYIRTPKTSELGPDSAEALAKLLTKVAQVIDALRKAEAAARSTDSELTAPQMLDRIRRMPTTERQQFARAVQGLNADAGKSGLA